MRDELLRTLGNLKSEIESGRIVGIACVGITAFCQAEAWISKGDAPDLTMLGGISAMQQKYRQMYTDGSSGVQLK